VALAFLAVYLVWGSTYLAIRFAVETLPPLSMAGVRFVVSGAILYAWIRSRGVARPERRQWWPATAAGGLMILVGNGGVVLAERVVPSGLAALMVAATPLWLAAIQWALPGGSPPDRRAALGLLAGFFGVLLLIGPDRLASGGAVPPAGAVALTVACIGWAAGSLYSRGARLPASPLLGAAMQMLAGGSLQLAAGALLGEWAGFRPAAVSERSLLALVYLTFVGSLIGYTCYLWLLRVTTPARAATYAYVNPVVAIFLGWALAGEPLDVRTGCAAAIILTSVALIGTARGGPAPPPQPRQEGDRGAAAE
jgi:drug/metabolite transporter (DMT)-like permease